MADEDEIADGIDGEEDDSGKGGKKKLIPIILVVLLLAGGAGAYFTGALDSLLGKSDKPACEEVDGEPVEDCEDDTHADDEHGDDKDDHGDEKSKKKDDDHGKKDDKAKKDDGHGKDGYGDEEDSSAFLAIPPMIVNLNTEDGTPRYLRLTVQLELVDPKEKSSVEDVMPRVIDQFQTYLRELRVRDLKGSAGIYRLQMELLRRVNYAVEPIEIKDVLFQEVLIQ